MGRVKLEMPREFSFTTELALRIGDINYGGHLGNDAVLSLVHEVRMRFLASIGCSETDACGCGMIMTDAIVVYRGEGRYGMVLKAETALDDFSSSGFDFLCLLSDKESGREIARVKTGMAFFDYERHRPARIPEAFMTKLRENGAAV